MKTNDIKQRTGTLWCKLFGHKYTLWSTTNHNGGEVAGRQYLWRLDYCVRCGHEETSSTPKSNVKNNSDTKNNKEGEDES